MKWKIIEKKEIYKDYWKGIEKWKFRSKECEDKEITIQTSRGFAVVFGITDDNKVLLVKEYFFAAQKHVYSLVAGILDEGKTPEQTAENELMEEAGCQAREFINLGEFCLGKYITGYAHIFLAKGVEKVQDQKLEDCEDIEIEFVELEEFKDMLKRGEIDPIPEVAASYRAIDFLENNV